MRVHKVISEVSNEGLGGSVGAGHTPSRRHRRLGGSNWWEGLNLGTPPTRLGRSVLARQGNWFWGVAPARFPRCGREGSLSLNSQVETVFICVHQSIDLYTFNSKIYCNVHVLYKIHTLYR